MKTLKRYVITFIISLGILLLILHTMDLWSVQNRLEAVKILSNGLAAIGAIMACFGVIFFVDNCEGYRGVKAVVYNVKKFFHYLLPRMFQRELEKDFYDYYIKKQKDKVAFAHLLTIGGGYLLCSGILAIVFEYL